MKDNKIIIVICLIIIILVIGFFLGMKKYLKKDLEQAKQELQEISWSLENDNEKIENVNIDIIEQEIDKVDTLESQHLILTPSKIIENTNFIQTYNDITVGNAKNDMEKFHVEISFKDNKGKFKLLGIDNLTKNEVLKIFKDYFENTKIPDTNEWYEVK